MPELDGVTQEFTAQAEQYLAELDAMIARAEALATATHEAEEAVAALALACDDAAVLLGGAAGQANELRDAIDGIAAASAPADAALSGLDGKLDDLIMLSTATVSELHDVRDAMAGVALAATAMAASTDSAAAATDVAGASAARTYGWWRLTGNAIHWIIAGSAELLAVLLPATVAAGAWAFAWTQGAQNVYQHMTSLFTATEALGQASGQTMGEMLGLSGVWQKIQNEANVNVYQALGAGLNLLKESFGGLAQTGLDVGRVFDTFAAKVVYDFSAAGNAGKTMGDLLHAMIPDLIGVGQFFGNLGAALASFASQMPGLAEVLLRVLDIITGGIKDIVEFASEIGHAGITILTVAMAIEEFNRWGSLMVGLMGRMGLATSELSGGMGSYFITGDRFIGIIKNLIGILPMAAFAVLKLAAAIPIVGEAIVGTTADIEAAEMATATWIAELSTLETLGIAAVVAGLGFLIDKIVTAQTSAQKLGASLQEAAVKASDMSVLGVISDNMQILSDKAAQATATISANAVGMEYAGGVAGRYTTAVTAQQSAFQSAGQELNGYNAAMVQQTQDTANVVIGAQQIGKAFGLTIPQAMALAQSANVSLTSAVKNQNGQWTVTGQKVAAAYSGYQAMGQASGAIGNDMLALAIQTGEAGTKMAQLNQAWDSWMQTVTGGTGGMASFAQSLQNIGNVVGDTKNNLGEASQISLTTSQFADALTSYGNQGAQAWTNFDQVVGSTAPNLIDWLRTAGTMLGPGFGKQIQQAGLDMISGLAPLAVHSKAAQTELLALAQNAGLNVSTFPQLEGLIKSTGASTQGLAGIVNTTTANLGSMAAAAQNLGDVMSAQMTGDISAAALKTSGYDKAVQNLTQDIKHYGAASPQAAAAAQQVTQDWNLAQQMAGQVVKMANAAQKAIDAMHGKAITINVSLAGDGAKYMGYAGTGSSGVYLATTTAGFGGYAGRAAGGFIDGPGTKTSDSIPVRASRGEFMMNASAVDHYGRAVMEAMNARKLAAGGPVTGGSPATSLLAAGGGGGSSTLTLNQSHHIEVKINSQVLGSAWRTEQLTYTRRNNGPNVTLRTR